MNVNATGHGLNPATIEKASTVLTPDGGWLRVEPGTLTVKDNEVWFNSVDGPGWNGPAEAAHRYVIALSSIQAVQI